MTQLIYNCLRGTVRFFCKIKSHFQVLQHTFESLRIKWGSGSWDSEPISSVERKEDGHIVLLCVFMVLHTVLINVCPFG